MKLIDVVKQNNRFIGGVFGNISEDIGEAISMKNLTPKIQMAYAYARRIAASALYLQGYFSVKTFFYINSIFKGYQRKTGHSFDFQEEAFQEALELLEIYNPKLTREVVSSICACAKQYALQGYTPEINISDNFLIDYFFQMYHSNFNPNNVIYRFFPDSFVIHSLTKTIDPTYKILAIIKNGKLIRRNRFIDPDCVAGTEGELVFDGPVYKIILNLSTSETFNIFYGITSQNIDLIKSAITETVLDRYSIDILKELTYKTINLFNMEYYKSSPTQYTYTLFRGDDFLYFESKMGFDAIYIPFNGSEIYQGTDFEARLHLLSINKSL